MIGMVWSGYLPLLVFRHVTGHAMYVVRTNAAMLYHQSVTPLDLVIGRCGLEMMGHLAAVALSYFVFYFLGLIDLPANASLVLVVNLYMAVWAFSPSSFLSAFTRLTS